jgi:hypothetical protein
MQNIFKISLLLVPFLSLLIYPQEKQLFGFGPFDFNSSREVVRELMKEKFDKIPGYEKEDVMGFEDLEFFHEKIHLCAFFFENDMLDEVDLVVENINRPTTAIFYNVIHYMTEEYGDPELYQPDEWTAEWFYYDLPGKKIIAVIKLSPYNINNVTTIKISFVKAN